jgi:elongation factor P hydroxylase
MNEAVMATRTQNKKSTTAKRGFYASAAHEAKRRQTIPISNPSLYAITYDMPIIPARDERVWIPQKQRVDSVWQARSRIYYSSPCKEKTRTS